MYGGKKTINSPKARRLLHVEVVEARGLTNPNLNQKQKATPLDTFVKVQLLDVANRPRDKETFSTSLVKDSSSPKYSQTFNIGAAFDLNVDDLPSIQLLVYSRLPVILGSNDTLLGVVNLDLNSISETLISDAWYPLESAGARDPPPLLPSGDLHLRINFDPRATDAIDIEAVPASVEDPEVADLPPNELSVVVLQARNLLALDTVVFAGEKSSDPFVKIKLAGAGSESPSFAKHKTKIVKKNLFPVWNEQFEWRGVTDTSLSLRVVVKDKDTFIEKFLGCVSISIAPFSNKKVVSSWYKLLGENGSNDGQVRGEVELRIHWRTSLAVLQEENLKMAKANKPTVISALLGKKGVALGDDDDDDDEGFGEHGGDDEEDENPPAPETPEEVEKRKKEEEETLQRLNDIVIHSGDYQIQVHIIEARDLKGENFDSTSDPFVTVECFGQRQHTRVVPSCNSCVFDELLIFNMKSLDKDQFTQGVVRISCKSSCKLKSSRMIGAYAFDTAGMYQSNKDHEFYRQWIALMDDEDAEDVGVQGYLKLSVFILGPGDKPKIHDEEKELQLEQQNEIRLGGDITSMVQSVPMIRKEWKFIVATIYKAQELPVMDGKTGIGSIGTKAKTDAVIKLQIAGGKTFKTQTVTVEGDSSAAINPQFFCEIWYPISIPSATNIVKLSVWDKEIGTYELIGNVVVKMHKMAQGRGPGRHISEDMRWHNIYGAPEFKTDSTFANIKKTVGAVRKGFKIVAGESDWKKWYNSVPDKAPCYKGRVLASFRVEKKRPAKYDTPEVKPFLRNLLSSKRNKQQIDIDVRNVEERMIPQDEYSLQALVVCGIDLPKFTSFKMTGDSQKLRVRISIGLHSVTTPEGKCDKGSCRWNARLKEESIKLPRDPSQVPDIFVHLLKEDDRPICFHRIRASDLLSSGEGTAAGGTGNSFMEPAKWFLLGEDKSIDCLNDDDFPGTVLIKLGFGLRRDALRDDVKDAWNRCDKSSKEFKLYQLRVHVYQGRGLPSADRNGLCDPYLNVSFMGQTKKTKTLKKTLYPVYYETLVFDNVTVCDSDHFQFASQVTFRLFDQDPTGSEYLGTFTLPLSHAVVTPDHNMPASDLPDPQWYDFFREVPGDGQGQLLALAQLIPFTQGTSIPVPNYKKLTDTTKHLSIVPESKDCYIEMIAVGLRDLAPFRFQAMQNPFLEISLDSVGSKYDSRTKASKLPDPANPNFLETIVMRAKLPLKAIFASPIHLSVSDTRLGGYSKPVVGVGSIDLTKKLPWCPEQYVAPGNDLFVHNIQTSADAIKKVVKDEEERRASLSLISSGSDAYDSAQRLKLETERRRLQDDFIVSPQAPDVTEILMQKTKDVDTGAGVFGALTHIKIQGGKSKAERAFATDLDMNEDETELPPAWMIGRKKLESDLETELKSSPFETYNLIRGKITGMLGSSLKVVGKVKGLVRVTEQEPHPEKNPFLPKSIADLLLRPNPYKIRLYVLRATGLAKRDKNINGSDAASDPYVRIKLGKFCFNDRENAIDDVTECDLYKMVEIDAELPGTSQLRIDMMDKDTIGSDDLIGTTVVDLEDRLFDARWKALGEENMLTGQDKTNKDKVRWATKPIERRYLTIAGQSHPQGVLECFVDIMRPEEAIVFPPEDISLPPKQMFEMRVVIWSARDVPPMDSFEGMSDLFVRVIPEGCVAQETDTHWRAKKGKASWNWRLMFDIELGHNSRAMKFPYVRFQLWDRDVLKWNDCAGECVENYGRYYRKAYKRNVAIKMFESKQGAEALRARRAAVLKPTTVVDTHGADVPPPENGAGSTGNSADRQAQTQDAKSADDPIKSDISRKPTSVPTSNVADDADDATTPLMKSPQEEKDDDDEEMKEQVNQFKAMTGLWPDIDPPDSAWINIGKTDHNTGKFIPMGSICYSVQIWPKAKAIVMPVGAGRNEPNTNPYLPPPVGRLKFSWNPFVLGTELCGPKICASLTCFCMCAAFVVLMIFCQPFLNIVINLVFVVCGA